jgi:hypothetical protein
MTGPTGNEIPVTKIAFGKRVSILGQTGDRKGLHVGGGAILPKGILTVHHVSQSFTSCEIGHEVEVIIRSNGKKAIATIVNFDPDLDLMLLTRPSVDCDKDSVPGKGAKLLLAQRGARFTMSYEDVQAEKVTGGRITDTTDVIGLHDASTEAGSSGEPLFLHTAGNPIGGIHKGYIGKENRFIPIPLIQSFLVNSAQCMSPVSGPVH